MAPILKIKEPEIQQFVISRSIVIAEKTNEIDSYLKAEIGNG